MKKSTFNVLVAAFLLAAFGVSCTTSNDVMSDNWIQKRKYQRGFFTDGGKSKEVKPVKAEEVQLAVNENKNEESNIAPSQTIEIAPASVAVNSETNATEMSGNNAVAETKNETKSSNSVEQHGKKALGMMAAMAKSIKPTASFSFSNANALKKNDNKWLKYAIICYASGLILYIIAVVVAVGSLTGGIGVLGIIGYLLMVAGTVFFIIWLVNKFG